MQPTPVIGKAEGNHAILFFPEEPANFGLIECWTFQDSHNEACLEYYRKLPNTSKNVDAALVDRAIAAYERIYNTSLRRVFRDSNRMRMQRWKRL